MIRQVIEFFRRGGPPSPPPAVATGHVRPRATRLRKGSSVSPTAGHPAERQPGPARTRLMRGSRQWWACVDAR